MTKSDLLKLLENVEIRKELIKTNVKRRRKKVKVCIILICID